MEKACKSVISSQGRFLDLHLFLLKLAFKIINTLKIRGYGRITKFLAAFLGRQNALLIRLHGKSKYLVRLEDPFWNLLLVNPIAYEPEIGAALDKVLDKETAFLDCGANCGFWSLKASELIEDKDRVWAVEASEKMYARLRETAEQNDNCFQTLHTAIDSESGRTVSFESSELNHAGAAIAGLKDFGTEVQTEEVITTSIDDIVNRHCTELHKLVIKLDVEGNEIPALNGARDTLDSKEVLVIYEDLGMGDSEEDITGWFLNQSGFCVFAYEESGTFKRIGTIEEVVPLRESQGDYTLNLFACKLNGDFSLRLQTPEG